MTSPNKKGSAPKGEPRVTLKTVAEHLGLTPGTISAALNNSAAARSIPERGQSFTFHGFRFRVLRRERNRITALRIVAVPREVEVAEKVPRRAGKSF